MIAEARRTGPKLNRSDGAIAMLHRILTEENLPYPEVANRVEAATGVRVVPQTIAAWAKRWGVGRQGRHRTDGRVREALRRLLVGGATIREARRVMRDTMGVPMSHNTITRYRREWGIKTHSAAPKPRKCDLCEGDAIRLYAGARWEIEGDVCGQCKDELQAEVQAAHRKRRQEAAGRARHERIAAADAMALASAKRRAEAERRQEALAESRRVEHLARAAFVRAEAFGLPIVNRRFAGGDLRGPAFTYWLRTTLAKDYGAIVLLTG